MDSRQVDPMDSFVSCALIFPYCRLFEVEAGALIKTSPRASGRKTNRAVPPDDGTQMSSPSRRRATSSCICLSSPFRAMSSLTRHTNSQEKKFSSPASSTPRCRSNQGHSDNESPPRVAPSSMEEQDDFQSKSLPCARVFSFISRTKATTWRALAVAWTVSLLFLLDGGHLRGRDERLCMAAAPSGWSLSSMSGREMYSPLFRYETKPDSLSPSSMRAKLPLSLPQQQVFSQYSTREGTGTATTDTPVPFPLADEAAKSSGDTATDETTPASPTESTGAAGATHAAAAISRNGTSAPSFAASKLTAASPRAAVSSLTSATLTPPAKATTPSTAAGHPAEAGLPSTEAATLAGAAATPSAGAALPTTGPAPHTRKNAAPAEPPSMHTILPTTPTDAREVSGNSTVEATSPGASARFKKAAGPGAPTHYVEEEAFHTAGERHHQSVAEQPSSEGRTVTYTEPDDKAAPSEAEAADPDADTRVPAEGSPVARVENEEEYFPSSKNNLKSGRRRGKSAFVQLTDYSTVSLAVLGKLAGKNSNNLRLTHDPALATEVYAASPERGDRRRSKEEAAVKQAEGARGQATGAYTAAQRAAALSQKRMLEKERWAARRAASKPTTAEIETAVRQADSRREDARGRGTERTTDTVKAYSCAAVLEPLVHRGLSAGAAEKIKQVLEKERFLNKVHELRKIAARRCLAGEEDACETPDRPAWQAAGLSKPSEPPSIPPFRLPAELCSVAGGSSRPQGTKAKGIPSNKKAGAAGYFAEGAKGQFDVNSSKYMKVEETEINKDSADRGASSLLAASGAVDERDGGSEQFPVPTRTGGRTDASVPGAMPRGHGRSVRRHGGNAAAVDGSVNTAKRNFEGSTSNTGTAHYRPLLPTQRSGERNSGSDSDSGSSHTALHRRDNQNESSQTEVRSSRGPVAVGRRGNNISRWSIFSNMNNGKSSHQEERLWGSPQVNRGGQHSTAADEGEHWNGTGVITQTERRHRRRLHRTRSAPSQLPLQADDSTFPLQSSVFAQTLSRGIFDMLQSLFGSGMDISNPQNFDGGNQGSFFNFMYPADTDYPWACVCDEHQYKRWELKEIEAVPCRNQVDTSAQGITAACDPRNHSMNAAFSSKRHLSAIVVGLLSVAVAFLF